MYTFRDMLKQDDNKEFIVVSAIDSPRGDERYLKVKNDLNDFCKKYLPDHKIHIIVEYNWGGTIADLWYSYLHIKSNNIDSNCYIAHFFDFIQNDLVKLCFDL